MEPRSPALEADSLPSEPPGKDHGGIQTAGSEKPLLPHMEISSCAVHFSDPVQSDTCHALGTVSQGDQE